MMQKLLFVLLLAPTALAFVSQSPQNNASNSKAAVLNIRTTTPFPSSALFAADDDETPPPINNKKGGIFEGISNFFQELDAFVDDASARRLGAGATFYGKRKSSFYGKGDKMKKADKDKYDPTEDYRVTAAGNYKWMEDEEGILRPVTRLKGKIMERN